MVHKMVLLYIFQLGNHIMLYLHYIFVLRIWWWLLFNTVHLFLYLVKGIYSMVVDRIVWSLLELVGTSYIFPDCLLCFEQKLVLNSLGCSTLMINCRIYTKRLFYLIFCFIFVFLYQLSLFIMPCSIYLGMYSRLIVYNCLLKCFLSLYICPIY